MKYVWMCMAHERVMQGYSEEKEQAARETLCERGGGWVEGRL